MIRGVRRLLHCTLLASMLACGADRSNTSDASLDATMDVTADTIPIEASTDSDVTFALTVTTSRGGAATGAVTPAPAGTACGNGCWRYPAGSQITLSASAGDGKSAFVKWGGACSGALPVCSLTVDSDKAVSATFNPYNYFFVTSKTYAPATLGGLAGADVECKSLATAAGLGGTKYVALLSSTPAADGGAPVNAIDRFPPNVRGWIRADGLPFIDQATDLFAPNPRTFYPGRTDETGADIPLANPLPYAVTATDRNGKYDGGGDCAGYTANTGIVDGGWAYDTYPWFTQGIGNACTYAWHLYCFEADWEAPVVVAIPSNMRLAFLTAGSYVGGEGVSKMDQHCADEAADAGLPGQYLAWMGTADAAAPTRFSADAGTWRRPDGVVLAPSASDLLDTTKPPRAALQQSANGTYDSRLSSSVWTGVYNGWNCNDWSTSTPGNNGGVGFSVASDTAAFAPYNYADCSTTLPVYCFQR